MFLPDSVSLTYTIFQSGIYLEMIPAFVSEKVAQTGLILFHSTFEM